jgi:hypothetical protein
MAIRKPDDVTQENWDDLLYMMEEEGCTAVSLNPTGAIFSGFGYTMNTTRYEYRLPSIFDAEKCGGPK